MKNKMIKPSFFTLFLLLLLSNLPAKTVSGIVVDLNTHEPLKGVTVMILDNFNNVQHMKTTDSKGVFLIEGIKEEKFNVRTNRYGYVNTVTGPYNLSRHNTINMLIRLENVPIPLEEVVVTSTKILPNLDQVNYNERKELGTGHYIEWNDFKDRSLSSIYDIFRGIPGLVVTNNGVFFSRYSSSVISVSQPPPSIYIDGALSMNNNIAWLNPENVQAVEAYNGLSAPSAYSRGKIGGVIMIWTKN